MESVSLTGIFITNKYSMVSAVPGWMRVSIHIHQEGWGHEVGCLLRLLIQHKTIGIPDQWSVISVEEHLVW